MNILFLTLAYNNSRNIYSDLMHEFRDNGHAVWVVCQTERRNKQNTSLREENGVNILHVKSGNITGKVSKIEKGITTLSIEYLFKKAISRYLNAVKFDLVIYSTPPITFCNVVEYIRSRDNAVTYLLLKDIFPQNAVDLGLIKENGLIHKFFKNKEKRLYGVSDYVGCMSEANRQYLIIHNEWLNPAKIEVNPNSVKPAAYREYDDGSAVGIRKSYDIPSGVTVFIYGGNLGMPQGLEFLVKACKEIKERENIFLMIVGDGNRYEFVAEELEKLGADNIRLLKKLPKAQYDELLTACDVGLIFLSPKFTIPNFPSRLTAYMEIGLPVIAATDNVTDIKEAILEAECGFWTESGNLPAFIAHMERLSEDRNLRRIMGRNGRKYMEEHYTVDESYRIIMRHFVEAGANANV